LSIPGMCRVASALLSLFALAWPGTLCPCSTWCPQVEVSTGVVEQREVALLMRRDFASVRELRNERHLLVVQGIEFFGLAQRLFDLQRKRLHAGAVDFHEIGSLSVLTADHAAGQFRCVSVDIGVGIVDVAVACGCRPCQSFPHGEVNDETKLLLTVVAARPDLVLFRQEYATDQWRQLFIVFRHLLQRRMRIRKSERSCATVVGAVRVYFTIDAAVLDVSENLLLEEIVAVLVKLIRRCGQWWQPVLGLLHPTPLTTLERWIAFFGARVLDAEPIESTDQPLASVDFIHANAGIELVGNLGEHGVAPA